MCSHNLVGENQGRSGSEANVFLAEDDKNSKWAACQTAQKSSRTFHLRWDILPEPLAISAVPPEQKRCQAVLKGEAAANATPGKCIHGLKGVETMKEQL